ncbi:MAG TPA: MaoC family dehydratase N-terminal domain-containing protein [Acidimicrobiales bacterium]
MPDAPATTYISPAMAAAVGTELSRQVSFPIAESDIRKWAIAVYYPEPPPRMFWDRDFAATTSHGDLVAPEDFNPFAWMAASPRGVDGPTSNDPQNTEKILGVDPPPVAFQLNGGISVTYGDRMRPGDVVTSVSRLGGYRERTGRLGLMLFTTLETTWTNQHDTLVRRTQGTVIRY